MVIDTWGLIVIFAELYTYFERNEALKTAKVFFLAHIQSYSSYGKCKMGEHLLHLYQREIMPKGFTGITLNSPKT